MPQNTALLSAAAILDVIEALILVIVLILGSMAAGAARRSAPFRVWTWPLEAAAAVGSLWGLWVLTWIRAAPAYLATCVAIGAALGVVAGLLMSTTWAAAGRLVLRRSGGSLVFLAFAYALVAAAAWWTLKPFMSAALGVAFLATGLLLADDATRLVKGVVWSAKIRSIPMAPPYEPPPPGEPDGQQAVGAEGAEGAQAAHEAAEGHT